MVWYSVPSAFYRRYGKYKNYNLGIPYEVLRWKVSRSKKSGFGKVFNKGKPIIRSKRIRRFIKKNIY